jgi:sugar lactone lactonase YvrE
MPVQGMKTHQLLTTHGHDVILFNRNQENAVFDKSVNSKNILVTATVETTADISGNRWNDGKADAKGRLWADAYLSRKHDLLDKLLNAGNNIWA